VTDAALRDITRYYTREAGVRGLDRELAKISRKVIKSILTKKKEGAHVSVNSKNLDKYLGVRKFTYGIAEKENQIGQVTGSRWTEVGGELLTIEAVKLPGKGNTVTTGKLGEVMQESIKAAISVVRARAKRLGIAEDFYQNLDLHIHLPEGATPKDGPSAASRSRPRSPRCSPASGALRRGDDRRDHAARRGAAHRRPEGEAARGAPRRHQERPHPAGEREGPAGDPRRGEERHRDHAGALVRRGAGARARAQARAAGRLARPRPRRRRRSSGRKWSSTEKKTPAFAGVFLGADSSTRKSGLDAREAAGKRWVPACNNTFHIKKRGWLIPNPVWRFQ
jgi:hypothetical protein